MTNKESVKLVVYSAIITVIAFILNFIEIPYFILGLKLDFSEVMTLLATSLNLYMGIIVAVVKGFLMMITGTSSGLIGEVTLIIGSLVIVFSYYFMSKKFNDKYSLLVMIIIFTIVMTSLNYFVITPTYIGSSWQQLAQTKQQVEFLGTTYTFTYLYYILIIFVPFNLIKATLDSILFYQLNKKLKKVLPQSLNFKNQK